MGQSGLPLSSVSPEAWAELDGLLDSVAAFTHALFHRVAAAFMDASDDAPYALHRALEVLVYDMVDAPELTYRATVELPGLGPLVYARHNEMLDLFCELLGPGFAALDLDPPDHETVSLCIGGGVWETVRRHALARRLHQLPDSLPALSYVCVSTFFGDAQARRVGALVNHAQRRAA
ncbi:hypothetical protein [Baekduia sp.]|jgi:hypothetical protein|uniref:hypothetical protein n=1 Tax=Baekduia sp. TaxID=2600305 RepID=UPI002E056A66|nr:hypothetical protein [Baekduia sp.]